jgi:hypothetical protein
MLRALIRRCLAASGGVADGWPPRFIQPFHSGYNSDRSQPGAGDAGGAVGGVGTAGALGKTGAWFLWVRRPLLPNFVEQR